MKKNKNKKFGTYIQDEVPENKFVWQSDHGLCPQTTVYRTRKFAKNPENTYGLRHTPMGSIMFKTTCYVFVSNELFLTL